MLLLKIYEAAIKPSLPRAETLDCQKAFKTDGGAFWFAETQGGNVN